MDDLSQRDLSNVADHDLTPEERTELSRRLDDFVGRVLRRYAPGRTKPAKPKRVEPWNPAIHGRKT